MNSNEQAEGSTTIAIDSKSQMNKDNVIMVDSERVIADEVARAIDETIARTIQQMWDMHKGRWKANASEERYMQMEQDVAKAIDKRIGKYRK